MTPHFGQTMLEASMTLPQPGQFLVGRRGTLVAMGLGGETGGGGIGRGAGSGTPARRGRSRPLVPRDKVRGAARPVQRPPGASLDDGAAAPYRAPSPLSRDPAMRLMRRSLAVAALVAASASVLPAQGAAPAAAGAPTGVRKELIQQVEDAERKLLALAEAVPQAKYAWRPAEGVRSIGEVFVHVAGANLMIPGVAGVPAATGITLARDAEKTMTDQAQIVNALRQSFAHVKQAIAAMPDADLDAPVTLFGQPTTKRGVFVLIATHAHEHLGQSIAYARMNGIAPPWSAGGGN